ncbi:MAG: beta-hydroxyacyl-ACP dehydratase [Syntrophales bacterium]|jgi:3-hydroxyacyl-[acyl-carrier-protein] dehydratase|nr:beta-hydroxyacyl-ACP dehydratase [Syntrophales bacterium]MCK9528768.1 beta-hydroxyacyl-ACP dehydratase [Syntrophales bacterium]MDX9922492.1 beta-hydroxyacyl-ACP dehydratase [Syntrophales bacterium]
MADRIIRPEEVLELVPQQAPFRFIDRIERIDDDHITGTYRFREDEYFYRGHFPGRPVTPGVILLETMAQTGVVALGIYLHLRRGRSSNDIRRMGTLFSTADTIEFNSMVLPGDRVIVRGTKVYLRREILKTHITMEKENGRLVCSGTLAGMGVLFDD